MNNLGNIYLVRGKYPQAEALYNETLAIERRVLGPAHASTLSTIQNLANVYGMVGQYASAETLFQETLEIQRRVVGPEHSDTLHAMVNLADTYYLHVQVRASHGVVRQHARGDAPRAGSRTSAHPHRARRCHADATSVRAAMTPRNGTRSKR